MFLNALEHLLRRKLITLALVLFAVFMLLFWWGVSSSAGAVDKFHREAGEDTQPMVGPEGKAWMALATAGPMLAAILIGLTIIMGAGVLPDEIASGRLSLWAGLPQSRRSLYLSTTLAPLALCTAFGYLFFFSTALVVRLYFPFSPGNLLMAVAAMPVWISVTWAAVTALSLVLGRIPAMLLSFVLGGISATMGSIVELGKALPEVGESGVCKVAAVVTALFPIDRGYRAIMAGLLPAKTGIDELLALMGYAGSVSAGEFLYPLAWAAVTAFLGFLAFRKIEIR